MNLLKSQFLLVAFLLVTSFALNAQKVTFDNVVKVRLQNSGPILDNEQVKGYYFFYEVDKVDRKSRAYMLQILDENMKEVSKRKFIKSKHTSLTEAAYNGNAFLFSFIDFKKKILDLVSYDKEMKRLGSRAYKLDKWGMSQFYSAARGAEPEPSINKIIYPVGNHGFMRYTMKKNKKIGYDLEYLPNNLKKAGSWNKSSPEASKTIAMAAFGDVNDKYLVSAITRKPKLLSNKNVTFSISVLDLETHKIAFEKELKTSKYIYSFMNAIMNDEKQSIMVFGEYFNPNDNLLKDKSQGLCALEYDMKGKIINKAHYSWKGKIKKHIGVDKKGRIEDGGHVAFHKIVKSDDGHFYAIGEMYKKAVSGLGIASQLLNRGGSNASMAKMVILDMILFDLNPDLTLNDVKVIEKRNSDFFLQAGMGHYPPSMLAYIIRAYGGFDYSYTQMSKDKTSFFSTFTAWEDEKKKGKKRGAYFGIIAHTAGDDDYVVDKIDLTTDASYISVFPAKPGYILISEYFKKAKKLETRLEKINY